MVGAGQNIFTIPPFWAQPTCLFIKLVAVFFSNFLCYDYVDYVLFTRLFIMFICLFHQRNGTG